MRDCSSACAHCLVAATEKARTCGFSVTFSGFDVYAAMKSGLEVLTRYQAAALASRGIAVNTIAQVLQKRIWAVELCAIHQS